MRVLIFFYLLPSCYCQGFSEDIQGFLEDIHGFLDHPGIGWLQSTGAWGWFYCNRRLFDNAKVWIYDKENIKDAMLSGPEKSNRNGSGYSNFRIVGTTREISKIEPYLYVEHWCNRKKGQTPIHFCLDIPSQYVTYGSHAKNLWHLEMELSKKQEGQRSC
ncbi:unnamed protein product [Cylicocyclus nassatus]|uniref:Uncharacterized protein n=1 Tax=Cylicocyclus nassatus TaxID=53992 RepID=A0AA36DSJ4_CYLNA|nr:unnamed protein product [Cylicocyclus nassatus]